MKYSKTLAHLCARALALGPFCLGVSSLLAVSAQAGMLEEAQRCTGEAQRLERLACFDGVFGTPLIAHESGSRPGDDFRNIKHSTRWREAYANAEEEAAAAGVRYRNTGQAAGHMVTVPALGAQPPRPLLVLQCHKNITELTLMLPEPLDAERVNLGLGTSETQVKSAWRVRDSGFVLSIGRGLPAIQAVKAIGSDTDIRVYSQSSRIDGFLFDLTGFEKAIRPLRKNCGW